MADTVTLLFTSSGSGKTVELAASAVTREAALAVLISAKDTKRLGDAQEAYSKLCTEDTRKVEETTYDLTEEEAITTGEDQLTEAKQKRQSVAAAILRVNIIKLKRQGNCRDVLKQFEELNGDNLKIVMCLDEVSSCPVLVRSIIHDRYSMGVAAAEALFGKGPKVKVVFSCGGTGAMRSTVRYMEANFICPVPSTEDVVKIMFDDNLIGLELICPDGKRRVIKTTNVSANLPIVHEVLGNGRMNSIAVSQFTRWDHAEKLDEGDILARIIDAFTGCNGLNTLDTTEEKQVMGACVFATMLFQPDEADNTRLPNNTEEAEKM